METLPIEKCWFFNINFSAFYTCEYHLFYVSTIRIKVKLSFQPTKKNMENKI